MHTVSNETLVLLEWVDKRVELVVGDAKALIHLLSKLHLLSLLLDENHFLFEVLDLIL